MDNIIFEKIMHDEDDFIAINVTAISELAMAKQLCYLLSKNIKKNSKLLIDFSLGAMHECYVQFGDKEGGYTPTFSLKFIKSDKCGHVLIEVDIEINDNNQHAHRSCFYVTSDLGSVERFGKKLIDLINGPIWMEIILNSK